MLLLLVSSTPSAPPNPRYPTAPEPLVRESEAGSGCLHATCIGARTSIRPAAYVPHRIERVGELECARQAMEPSRLFTKR